MQKVVRTYPEAKYKEPTASLQIALKEGWTVVMANKFDICSNYNGASLGIQGMEYILEKDTADKKIENVEPIWGVSGL